MEERRERRRKEGGRTDRRMFGVMVSLILKFLFVLIIVV